MGGTIIDKLYADNLSLLKFLDGQKEVSFQIEADKNFRKLLLLSAASYFETEIIKVLIEFATLNSRSGLVIEFIKKGAIERRYHMYFDWKNRKANSFFGLFGTEFSSYMKEQMKAAPDIERAVESFMEIGAIRNELVHENFAVFPLEKTSEEIYALYKFGNNFPHILHDSLHKVSDTTCAVSASIAEKKQ